MRVIEDWTTADYLAALGTSGELRRFRILVSGPMPGRPEESGEFVMLLRQSVTVRAGGSARKALSDRPDPVTCVSVR